MLGRIHRPNTAFIAWHAVPYGVARRAISVPQRATRFHNSLKTLYFRKPGQCFSLIYQSNPLFLLAKTALQHQLRMVCAFDRVAGPKPSFFASHPSPSALPASKLGVAFGTALRSLVVVMFGSSVALADGWQPVASSTSWASANTFGQSAAPARAAVASQPFVRAVRQSQGPAMDRLLSLISLAESPRRGYDAINYGAKVLPSKPPSQMTIAEIQAWVRATPGQPHAIGRNQIIPDTFNRVVRALGLPASTVYDRRTQDLMGRYLVEEAGYSKFISGQISRTAFMDNLAKVWAGLPLANGRSAYHGYAGNRATISRGDYVAAMAEIFPVRRASN